MAMDGLDAFVDSHPVVCFVLHVLGYYMNCASINIYIFFREQMSVNYNLKDKMYLSVCLAKKINEL